MSGDQLRHAAIVGDAPRLSHLLSGGANPCSSDAADTGGGMTALHYAAWNGHADCVASLLANDRGRMPGTGEAASCVDLATEAGQWTALHLCAMSDDNGRAGRMEEERDLGRDEEEERGAEERNNKGGERGGAAECCRLLILCGADAILRDGEGRTALQVAEEGGNADVTKILREKSPSAKEISAFRESHRAKYAVQTRRNPADGCSTEEGKEEDWISRCYSDNEGALSGPDAFADKVPVPRELNVHEHRLLAFAKRTFKSDRTDGARKIRDMVSAWEQAERNVDRRERLANARWRGEWKRLEFPKVLKAEKKQSRRMDASGCF